MKLHIFRLSGHDFVHYRKIEIGANDRAVYQQSISCFIVYANFDWFLINFLLQFVSGEDVMDIYHAMIRHLEYEVVDVEMVEFGHYQAHVRIANLNNSLVAGRAVELFKARYNKGLIGNALQGLSDLGSDKSQLVAEILMQSSDDYYEAEDSSYWIVKDVAINIVKENGQWTPTLDFEALIYACLGLG